MVTINTTLSKHFASPHIIAKIIGKSTFHVPDSVFPNKICEICSGGSLPLIFYIHFMLSTLCGVILLR